MIQPYRQSFRLMIAAALLILAWASQAQSQCVPLPGEPHMESFLSLATVGGLSYPSDIELILQESGDRVEATLRDNAGEQQPRETKLIGTLQEKQSGKTTACEVDLTGKKGNGTIKIHGTIRPADFLGTIRRRVGRDTYSEKVSLKRRLRREDLDTGTL